jgi:hypothetical protein
MGSINHGRNKAVVDLPNYHFSGVFAWFVWMFVHLFSLIGFKNKQLYSWIGFIITFDLIAKDVWLLDHLKTKYLRLPVMKCKFYALQPILDNSA